MTNTWIFDVITIDGGHELGWLHQSKNNEIAPEDLYMDKYDMEDAARDIVLSGQDYENYFFDPSDIDEWVKERDRCEECEGDGTIVCPTYDDPYNEEPCPECTGDEDRLYELKNDK